MTIETRLAEIRARADESAVEEMGGCVLPTEIGMRAAFEWLAIQEGVRPDWYLEEVPTILAGIDAARRLLAAERAMAAALTDVMDRHKPEPCEPECGQHNLCAACWDDFPCATVRGLAEKLAADTTTREDQTHD